VSAAEDSNDAAFGALRAGQAADALKLCEDMVAVHGVLDCIAWNENVAIELRHGRIRDNESVAIVVQNETALHFIPGQHLRNRFCSGTSLRLSSLAVGCDLPFTVGKPVTAAGELFDGAAFLEFGEHFE
jgi:hypothetical protein